MTWQPTKVLWHWKCRRQRLIRSNCQHPQWRWASALAGDASAAKGTWLEAPQESNWHWPLSILSSLMFAKVLFALALGGKGGNRKRRGVVGRGKRDAAASKDRAVATDGEQVHKKRHSRTPPPTSAPTPAAFTFEAIHNDADKQVEVWWQIVSSITRDERTLLLSAPTMLDPGSTTPPKRMPWVMEERWDGHEVCVKTMVVGTWDVYETSCKQVSDSYNLLVDRQVTYEVSDILAQSADYSLSVVSQLHRSSLENDICFSLALVTLMTAVFGVHWFCSPRKAAQNMLPLIHS